MNLRVPHPSRSLRRVGSYDPKPPNLFFLSVFLFSVLSVSFVVNSSHCSPKTKNPKRRQAAPVIFSQFPLSIFQFPITSSSPPSSPPAPAPSALPSPC